MDSVGCGRERKIFFFSFVYGTGGHDVASKFAGQIIFFFFVYGLRVQRWLGGERPNG